MPRKSDEATQPLGDLLDAALGGILASGWDDPVGEAVGRVEPPTAPPTSNENWEVHVGAEAVKTAIDKVAREYPPLPVRDDQPPPRARKTKAPPKEPATFLEPQPNGGALMRTVAGDDDEPPVDAGVFNVGALADLASGRATAGEVAGRMGVELAQLQSELAVALRDMDPKEIAKALGLQAAEQQLKSGAVYGAVLADLVADMAAGRLKADTKIELAKLLARVGRIEPKEDKSVGAGQGFSLHINLGNAPAQPITIDAN